MQIIDTVVLLAFLDQSDSRFDEAGAHILNINLRQDIFVPSAASLELDLELKTHGVRHEARVNIHSRLGRLIPESWVLPQPLGCSGAPQICPNEQDGEALISIP